MSFEQSILRGSYYIMKDLRHQCHLSLGFYIAIASMEVSHGVFHGVELLEYRSHGQSYKKGKKERTKSPNLKLG